MANFSVMLPAEIFKIRSHLLTLSLEKPRQNSKIILETHELFVYGDVQSVINSFHANGLSVGTP